MVDRINILPIFLFDVEHFAFVATQKPKHPLITQKNHLVALSDSQGVGIT